ncbi:hypothetical protein [Sinomonas albida]|uniref:hypothetical protein n=1 Tax=Sinomonas albida TaxID=369942 RepID=UPI0030158DCD
MEIRTPPYKWAKPDGPVPGPDVDTRLQLGNRVWKTLASAEGPNGALTRLMGSNPRLD